MYEIRVWHEFLALPSIKLCPPEKANKNFIYSLMGMLISLIELVLTSWLGPIKAA